MAELGVGVRVRTGWNTDDSVEPGLGLDPRLTEGVVTGGPYMDEYRGSPAPFWDIKADNGYEFSCHEQQIFPIDDGDPVTTEETDLAEA